jgi:polyisoprenoid-binding protein YceI
LKLKGQDSTSGDIIMSITATDLGITAGTWNIDPAHSEVSFKIRHLMSKVRGTFTKFSGAIVVTEDLVSSTAAAEIDVNSVDTRNADRDAHIRSKDILGTDEHQNLTFATSSVHVKDGEYYVDGTLTVKGVAKPVNLSVEFNGVSPDPWGGTRAGFTASTEISRKEYGIDFNLPVGEGALLGDKVEISLEIQAVYAA